MDKKILVASAVFFGISIGLFLFLANVIKGFLKSKSTIIIYCFLSILAFSITAFLGYEGFINDPMTLLITFQVCFLFFGIINFLAVKHFFGWAENKNFFDKLGFSLFVCLISLIPFLFIFKMINNQGFHFLMLTSAILFITPLFFIQAFESAVQIPVPEYKKWYYPLFTKLQNNEALFKEHLLISLVMLKKISSDVEAQFKVRAPEQMPYGNFFYFFLESSKDKTPESQIDYLTKHSKPYGWVFYFKSRWSIFTGKTYIDPDLTVEENNIKENSIIVCERADGI